MTNRRALLCVILGLATSGCEHEQAGGAAPAQAAPAKPVAAAVPVAPAVAAEPLKCTIDPKHPGDMERGGRARLRIEGPGVSIDASDVPALCGPMYNQTSEALGVSAGEGLLFRTCLPDGSIELSAATRAAGKQLVHAGTAPRGTDVIFEKYRGHTYSTMGGSQDAIVVNQDFSRVDATVELHDVESDSVLKATLTFDCTQDERAAK